MMFYVYIQAYLVTSGSFPLWTR